MPTKSEIKGRLMAKLSDGSYVEIPEEISLEGAETIAEQYEFVRVVRCRDCKHWCKEKDNGGYGHCKRYDHYARVDCYCSDGQRREDETND